jgi:hypothetical protein
MKFNKPTQPAAPTVRRSADEINAGNKVTLDAFKNSEAPPDKEFKRVPFGSAQMKLDATDIPGYHLHWINDWHPQYANRLTQAMQAGYKFVSQQESETAQLLGASTSDMSDRVSRTVGTRPSGEPITAYLMKIPTEWWIEHQKPVWDRADAVDTAIRRGAASAKVEGGYNPTSDPIKLTSKLQHGHDE